MTSTTRPTDTWIARLRTELDGRLIEPGEDGYDEARTVVTGGIDRRPALVVRAASTNDVVRAVTAARSSGGRLTLRCHARLQTCVKHVVARRDPNTSHSVQAQITRRKCQV